MTMLTMPLSSTKAASMTALFLSLLVLLNTLVCHAWVSPAALPRTASSLLYASSRRDDLEFLPLTESDLSRLAQMRDRHVTIPIMILDAMLPGQCLEFGSADPKFQRLLQHVLSDEHGEIGMIGLNPHTGRPLNLGVRTKRYYTS